METHVADLCAEYEQRNISTAVLLPTGKDLDQVAAKIERSGAHVQRLDTDARNGRSRQIQGLYQTLRIIRGFRPNIVHVQTGGATGGAAAVLIGRLAGARVLITEHDVPSPNPRLSQRISRRAIDALSHCIIAVSRRNGLLRRDRLGAPASRTAVILNGVPEPKLDPTLKSQNRSASLREANVPEDALVVGSVVRLASGKGLDDLINAFALLPPVGSPLYLILIGDGPLRAHLEELTRERSIDNRVRFLGYHADPTRYIDAMDLFVLPVPAGSMSIALLEAMMRGTPSMITFCGPEEAVIHGETGYCAPPADPERLASAIREALADRDSLSRIGHDGAHHVRQHFSVRRVADDTLEVYQRRRGDVPARLRLASPPTPFPGMSHGGPTAQGCVAQR